MKKVYIAGPMRGYPEMNFPEFNRVAKLLRDYGYDVFNPAETDEGDISNPRSYYLRIDLVELSKMDALFLLENWESSPGAKMEALIAYEMEVPIHLASDVVMSRTIQMIPNLVWAHMRPTVVK